MRRPEHFPLNARWFQANGFCQCGKPAQGRLMGTSNEDFGPYCKSCATKAIGESEKARELWQSVKP